jgi:hypothetical protein
MKLTTVLLVCLATLLCCQSETNIRDLPMTQANLQQVKTTAQLTGEEIGCLQAYMLHQVITTDNIDSTVTIGAAIDQGRKLIGDSLTVE